MGGKAWPHENKHTISAFLGDHLSSSRAVVSSSALAGAFVLLICVSSAPSAIVGGGLVTELRCLGAYKGDEEDSDNHDRPTAEEKVLDADGERHDAMDEDLKEQIEGSALALAATSSTSADADGKNDLKAKVLKQIGLQRQVREQQCDGLRCIGPWLPLFGHCAGCSAKAEEMESNHEKDLAACLSGYGYDVQADSDTMAEEDDEHNPNAKTDDGWRDGCVTEKEILDMEGLFPGDEPPASAAEYE